MKTVPTESKRSQFTGLICRISVFVLLASCLSTARAQDAAPAITTQPTAQTVLLGASAAFTIAATGNPAPTYQWQFNGVNIPGATSAILTISEVLPANTGQYDAVVTNTSGSATSSIVTLYINDPLASNTNWLNGLFNYTSGSGIGTGTSAVFQNGNLELPPDQGAGSQLFPSPGANGAPMIDGFTPALMGTTTANWSVQVDVHGSAIAIAVGSMQGYGPGLQFFNLQAGQNYSNGGGIQFSYNLDGQNGAPPLGRVDTGFYSLYNSSNGGSSISTSATDFTFRATYTSSTHQLATFYSTDGGVTWTMTYSFDVTMPNVNGSGGWGMTVGGGPSFGIDLDFFSGVALASSDAYMSNFTYSGLVPGQWLPTSTYITADPTSSQSVASGGSVVLNVAAIGGGTLQYQWFLNGTALTDGPSISGSTTATLTLSSVGAAEAGSYTVQVTNGGTPVTSTPATVIINNTRLANISTRAQVGVGGSILIPGFVISGSGMETLLVRADGPALTQFGVTGVLAQPILSVFDGSGKVIASNTGWGTNANTAQIASVAAQVGAFPLASGSADCALIISLPPGGYTVQVAGVNNTTGVALAEIYEVP